MQVTLTDEQARTLLALALSANGTLQGNLRAAKHACEHATTADTKARAARRARMIEAEGARAQVAIDALAAAIVSGFEG